MSAMWVAGAAFENSRERLQWAVPVDLVAEKLDPIASYRALASYDRRNLPKVPHPANLDLVIRKLRL